MSGGRGVTEPSLLENYAQALPYYFGNPSLRPEVTTTYEAGVSSEWWSRRVRTEVDLVSAIPSHDLIAFVGDTWENIEASWARGVETSAQARVTNNIRLMGSYMRLYTDIPHLPSPESSDTGIGEPLVRRPRNSGSLSIAVTPKRWSLVVGGSFDWRTPGRRLHLRSHAQSRLSKHIRQCVVTISPSTSRRYFGWIIF